MTVFRCFGPDGEDLTAAVEAKVKSRPTTIYRLRESDEKRRHRRSQTSMTVVVHCSEGHKNVFEVRRDEF